MRPSVCGVRPTCSERKSEAEKISSSGNEGDVVFAGDDGGDEGVVADDVHAEGLGAASDFKADAAAADDAERLAAELGALQRFFVPLGRVHGGVGARDAAAHGDHEAEGEFGDGDGVGAGGVHDDDAAARGLGCVDVVDANAGAADDAELGSGGEQGRVGLDGGADDEGVGVGEFGGQTAGRNLVGGDDIPAGLFLQDGERGGRDFFCENDLQRRLQCGFGACVRNPPSVLVGDCRVL